MAFEGLAGKWKFGRGESMEFKLDIKATDEIKNYYRGIVDKCSKQYDLCSMARAEGFDPSTGIETTPAVDLADRSETIVGPKGVAEKYRALYKKYHNREKAVFQIFREIIENEEWVGINGKEKRVEQAIKTALVLITEGVVVAPIDGLPSVRISRNPDGSEYVDVYYAGPIRAAGGTSQVLPLVLGDYAKVLLGLDRYKPTDEEIERYVEEVKAYGTIYSRQYPITDSEIRTIIRGCPVCINGEPTEEQEVSSFRDLKRFPSNRIRGGTCLVINDGIALKAAKILKFSKTLGLDWSWLEKIIKVKKSSEKDVSLNPNPKYLEAIAAGRPILAYPLRPGGFRLRYGKSRNNGLMGKCIHPATMHILDEFIGVGTQLKVERPGKSTAVFPCDSIDGPIVRLKSGEVRKINNVDDAISAAPDVERILFLGDILVTYGDFKRTAHPLVPAGYCSEWWKQELKKAAKGENRDALAAKALEKPDSIDAYEAFELSEKFSLPLHPNHIHYYIALTPDEVVKVAGSVRNAEKIERDGKIIGLRIGNAKEIKPLLEKIWLPHRLEGEKIFVGKEFAYSFFRTFGGLSGREIQGESTLEILSSLSGVEIRDKGGTFIGARMGRPEAAKPRRMIGNPHVLFPIGLYGGSERNIAKAIKEGAEGRRQGKIKGEIAIYKCSSCGNIVPAGFCSVCGRIAERARLCIRCGKLGKEAVCRNCNGITIGFNTREIDVAQIMEAAASRMNMRVPDVVKGVKGLINNSKVSEPVEKGILRSKYDLHIFRDGTIRFDLMNAPLTHFTPKEIGTGVEKLKELGYAKAADGTLLQSDEQIVELFPQDIIINESAGEFFVRVANFIDDLLKRFYGLEACHSISSRQELIGELVLGLAPHTSAGIIGRIIGYTKAKVNFAHPYFHLTKRRNIDGDQDSLLLLSDALINFSPQYLPETRGARMDAPIVFTVVLKPTEIDDEAFDMESCSEYPLELYEKAMKILPADIDSINRVEHKLEKDEQYSGLLYTHETSCFDSGPKVSRYVQLATMEEKLRRQAVLQGKIAAIDEKDALERVMRSHFIPDMIGNTRAFSRQTFRCTKCNTRYRRIPLSGKCKCMGNIILTISEGSARKYLKIAKDIISEYGLSAYLSQRIMLIENEMNSVFRSESTEQKTLSEYA